MKILIIVVGVLILMFAPNNWLVIYGNIKHANGLNFQEYKNIVKLSEYNKTTTQENPFLIYQNLMFLKLISIIIIMDNI
jgi:hypothetical protein